MLYVEFFDSIEVIKMFSCEKETRLKMISLLKKLIKKYRLSRVYINDDEDYVSVEFIISRNVKFDIGCHNNGTLTKEITEYNEDIFKTLEDLNEI